MKWDFLNKDYTEPGHHFSVYYYFSIGLGFQFNLFDRILKEIDLCLFIGPLLINYRYSWLMEDKNDTDSIQHTT